MKITDFYLSISKCQINQMEIVNISTTIQTNFIEWNNRGATDHHICILVLSGYRSCYYAMIFEVLFADII